MITGSTSSSSSLISDKEGTSQVQELEAVRLAADLKESTVTRDSEQKVTRRLKKQRYKERKQEMKRADEMMVIKKQEQEAADLKERDSEQKVRRRLKKQRCKERKQEMKRADEMMVIEKQEQASLIERKLKRWLRQAAALLSLYQPMGSYDVRLFTGFAVDMKTLRGFPLDIFASGLGLPLDRALVKTAMLNPGGVEEKELKRKVVHELAKRKQLLVKTRDSPSRDQGSLLERIMGKMETCLTSRGLSSMPKWRPHWKDINTLEDAIAALACEFVKVCVEASMDPSTLNEMVLEVVFSLELPQLENLYSFID